MFPSSLLISGLLCFGVTLGASSRTHEAARIDHVVLLALDGLSSEGLEARIHTQPRRSAAARGSFEEKPRCDAE